MGLGTRRIKIPKIWFHSTVLLISFRMIPHMPIIVPAKLKFVFLGLRPHLRASTGTRRVKIPEICFHSTLLLISFRMIPHMPRVKLKFIYFFLPLDTGVNKCSRGTTKFLKLALTTFPISESVQLCTPSTTTPGLLYGCRLFIFGRSKTGFWTLHFLKLCTKTMSRDYTMTEWARLKFRVIFWNLKSSSFPTILSNLSLLVSFMPKFGL